ncbi:MAG: hypothetical protein ABL958_13755 [Bdellovibrionia bacterium]
MKNLILYSIIIGFGVQSVAQVDPQLAIPSRPEAVSRPESAPQLPTVLPPKVHPPVLQTAGTTGGAANNEEVPLPPEPVVVAPVAAAPVVVEKQGPVISEPIELPATPEQRPAIHVESSAFQETPAPNFSSTRLKAKPTVRRTPRFALSVHYSTIGRFSFYDGTRTDSGVKTHVEGDFGSRTAMGAGLSVWSAYRDSWGFMAGVSFEGSRELDSVHWKTSATGGNVFSGGRNSTLLMAGLEGNGVFRTGDLYFLAGLNATLPAYQKAAGEPGSTTLRGGLGAQAGIGGFANESVSFEALYKIISIGINYKDAAGEFDSGPVISDGFQLQTKFTF